MFKKYVLLTITKWEQTGLCVCRPTKTLQYLCICACSSVCNSGHLEYAFTKRNMVKKNSPNLIFAMYYNIICQNVH